MTPASDRYIKRITDRPERLPKSTPSDELNRRKPITEKIGEFISRYLNPDNPPKRNRVIGRTAIIGLATTGLLVGGLIAAEPTDSDFIPPHCTTDTDSLAPSKSQSGEADDTCAETDSFGVMAEQIVDTPLPMITLVEESDS